MLTLTEVTLLFNNKSWTMPRRHIIMQILMIGYCCSILIRVRKPQFYSYTDYYYLLLGKSKNLMESKVSMLSSLYLPLLLSLLVR